MRDTLSTGLDATETEDSEALVTQALVVETPAKSNHKKGLPARTQARRAALQALYQQQLNPSSLATLEIQFLNDPSQTLGNERFFLNLIRGILGDQETIDLHITQAIDRPIHQLNPVELAALRIGTFELLNDLTTPYRVVINESIELTKAFGSEGGHAYVNGVLDKLAHQLRRAELSDAVATQ